jgi:hypothetical protein
MSLFFGKETYTWRYLPYANGDGFRCWENVLVAIFMTAGTHLRFLMQSGKLRATFGQFH